MIMHNYLGKLEALRWINLLTLLPSRITGVGSGWRDKVYWRFHYPAALGSPVLGCIQPCRKVQTRPPSLGLASAEAELWTKNNFLPNLRGVGTLENPRNILFLLSPMQFPQWLSTWPMHLGLPGETIGAKGSLSQGSQLIWKKIFQQWLHWEACCWNTEQISHSLFQYLPWNPWPNSSERLSLFSGPIPFIRNAYIYSPLFTDPEAIFERAGISWLGSETQSRHTQMNPGTAMS